MGLALVLWCVGQWCGPAAHAEFLPMILPILMRGVSSEVRPWGLAAFPCSPGLRAGQALAPSFLDSPPLLSPAVILVIQ